ncbi:MAG: hypothetical protein CMM59_06010 [Rhodospirillaceae bacterium]|nr:hypothetical protein [Rhodospirillaceae bacterium]
MRHSSLFLGLVFGLLVGLTSTDRIAYAKSERPYPGTHVTATPFSFSELRGRLEAAIQANGMFIVTPASASAGAKRRGITIPGNLVLGVYRNDFAVRMLKASVASGIEAPLRFYVTENADGTATLTYRKPSAVFGVYGSADLDRMAAELDAIWAKIVTQTVTK